MFVPKAGVIDLEMTVEEGAKLIVSIGMVVPDYMGEDDVSEIMAKIPSPADSAPASDDQPSSA